jgi:hypothetical protein
MFANRLLPMSMSALALVRCGPSTMSTDAAIPDGSRPDATSASDSAITLPDTTAMQDQAPPADTAASDASVTADSTAPSDGGGALDGSTDAHMVTIGADVCYTFATASGDYSDPCSGDMYTEAGANIDIAAGSGSSALCLVSGTYSSLAAVPSDYSTCAWSNYVEGGGGLTDQGLIVLDAAGVHHYRVWIQSNSPNLVFSWDRLD